LEDAFADRFGAVDEFFFHAINCSLQILSATGQVISDDHDHYEGQGD
jgi:hypothetical protein